MPSFEHILLSSIAPEAIDAAKSRQQKEQGCKKWLFCDPELTDSSEGMRKLCVKHHVLISKLIGEQYGWNKKQIEPALQMLNDQHGGVLFKDVKRESWALKQMDIHIRHTDVNSIDFTRVPAVLAPVCALHRQKRRGTTAMSLAAVACPSTPRKSSAESLPAPSHRLTVKTSPSSGPTTSRKSFGSTEDPTSAESPNALPRCFTQFSLKRMRVYSPRVGAHHALQDMEQAEEEADEEPEEETEEEQPEIKEPHVKSRVAQQPESTNAKVYYDYSMNALVKLFVSGAMAVAAMSNGPNGFRVGTFPDGSYHESEEANESEAPGVPMIIKKEKQPTMKKPAAKEPVEQEPVEKESVATQPVVPVPVPAHVPAPKAKAKEKEKEAHLPDKPPRTVLQDGSTLWTTFAAGQAYIQACAKDVESKSLLVSLDAKTAERHGKHPWKIILAIFNKMVQTGQLLPKAEAVALKQQLLSS